MAPVKTSENKAKMTLICCLCITKYDLTETNFSKNIQKSIKFTDALYDIEDFVEVSYMLFNI